MKTSYEDCIGEIAKKLKKGKHVKCLISDGIDFLCVAYVEGEDKPYRGISYNVTAEQISVKHETVKRVVALGDIFDLLIANGYTPDCFGYWHSDESTFIFKPEMWGICGNVVDSADDYPKWMVENVVV